MGLAGNLGQGYPVKAGTVQDAIGAIGEAFELDSYDNPIYKPGTTNYHLWIGCQIKAFKLDDPPPQPQLAVPSNIYIWIYHTPCSLTCPHIQAMGQLFLLCIGEYTTNHTRQTTRTQQFWLQYVALFCHHQSMSFATLPANQPCQTLHDYTLTKNGCQGQIIAHHNIPNPCSL